MSRRLSPAQAQTKARTEPAFARLAARYEGSEHRVEIDRFNIARTLELERYITRLWARRGITWEDHTWQLD